MIDPFGRTISYLRVSVTDRCDFRCVYCMAEDMTFLPKADILTLEELDRLCSAFVRQGVRKLRLTGGEPLVRKNVMGLVRSLSRHLASGAMDELTLTTNGSQLARYAGELADCGVRRVNVSIDTLDAKKFTAITRWGRLDQVFEGLLGAHNASNAMAGLAVALEAGVDLDAAVAALASLTAGDKRGQVIEISGATILNDSYNSNPEALRSMIRTLAARPAAGRHILVAGEMLELGEHGTALHIACGRAAAEAGLDLVVAVQGNAEHLATAACAGGVPAVFLRDADAAGQWLVENLRPGDVVLVKGSRGVHLERAIETLSRHVASQEAP